jgi:predicted Zn-dependent peptidase
MAALRRTAEMTSAAPESDTTVATLANGVRVVTIRLPRRETVNVSVYVRTGSQHETRRTSGISHVVEHMAFKGTRERDCQRINLDAEVLGAEVNAHTDKDHTAFHIEGLARDMPAFLGMLGDIVQCSVFPEGELERERQVLLHEVTEDEEDALSTAFKLFDLACYGSHPVARPVIGSRRNIERVTRADLLAYVQRQYTAGNVVVGVAGDVDPQRVAIEVQAAFGAMRRGGENLVAAPAYLGGIRSRRLGGSTQTHVVLGYPIPSLHGDYCAQVVAATLFGEGMSSPLLDQIRERRGLAYHTACSADVSELCGQFVVEASTAPEHVPEFLAEVDRLLAELAATVDPVALQRARNQLTVRGLKLQDRPSRRLEFAALDLFVHGQVRSPAQWLAQVQAVGAADIRAAVAQMRAAPAAVALAGRIGKGVVDRVTALYAAPVAASA